MYEGLKLLHVLAVVLFVGNITTGVFWKAFADRSKDPRLIAHTMAGIIASDRVFTIPGVFLILIGGIGAALVAHLPLLRTPWIGWSIALFAVSGVAFSARLAPVQRELLAVARAGAEGTMDWNRYAKLSASWKLWGLIALATPLLAVALMVTKPGGAVPHP